MSDTESLPSVVPALSGSTGGWAGSGGTPARQDLPFFPLAPLLPHKHPPEDKVS